MNNSKNYINTRNLPNGEELAKETSNFIFDLIFDVSERISETQPALL